MELFHRLSNTQIIYWVAYLNIWPSGEEAQDARFATLRADLAYARDAQCYTMARVQGGRGAKPKPGDPKQYMPLKRGAQKAKRTFNDMTQQEIADRMATWAKGMEAAHSGSDT